MQKQCLHHARELEFFCETCKELVCDHCLTFGPHQTKNHKIINFHDAYQIRHTFIRERIENGLKPKKELLADHLAAIDRRLHEIQAIKSTIDKDVTMEFEGGIIKRLNDSFGSLTAVLQKDVAWLQKNLNEIDDFIHTFEYLALTESNVLPLLFMSKTLQKQLMNLLSILIKTEIKQHPADLPRELLEFRTKLQNGEPVRQQMELKKQLIVKCRLDKLRSLEKISKEFFERIQDEIYDWVRLLKRILTTIDSLCLVCTFCGCFIDVVNEQCPMNEKDYEEVQLEFVGITKELPKMKQFGNSQHFYGNPRPEFLVLKKDKYPQFGEHIEQRRAAKEIYFKVFRSLWFSIIDLKARKFLQQIDLQALFEKYDPEKKGWLTLVKFKYLLNKELQMSVEEVDRLSDFFRDEKEDKIEYSYFLEVDWYLEELKRLEDQVKLDWTKYPRLFNRRVRSKSPTQQAQIQAHARSPVAPITQPVQIYSTFTRFSQKVEEKSSPPAKVEAAKFGFTGRVKQEERQKDQELKGEKTLKSSVRSSSLQTKRVQFEGSSVSRFSESQSGGNYSYKYY